ncbi:MAG: hypothetical protein Q8W44_12190 [Candidatus Palauibacterales bacterium]|nr:hypothetical protein [Candidatus Palauibacterales bacterium]
MDGSLPYLAAGFGLTWIVMVLYAWRLEARIGRVRDGLRRHDESTSRVEAPGGRTAGAGPPDEPDHRPEEAR